jgi:predicted dehydrogenase
MNQTTRVGIIGSGFAEKHVQALNQIQDVEIVAVCSRNEGTARNLINQSNGQNATYYAFDQYLGMLRSEKLDAVYISLPPFLHGEIEIACSEHVKGLFIEKPVALDLETAGKMLDSFQRAESIVSTGYMNRYRTNIQSAKSYFRNDPALLYNGAWCEDMPPPYWWRRRELSGGQLTEQCTHIIDAVRFLSGEIQQVQALSTRGFITDVEDYNVDDAMVMNFMLENGATGSLHTSCFTKSASHAAMGIYLTAASREKVYRFDSHACDLTIQHHSSRSEQIVSTDDPILLENQVFINALISGDSSKILSPFQDAIETLKVSLAADLSIQEKRNVKIAEL